MGAVKMHDDNDNVCEIPTSYSRQLCYHMFCLECGWNVKFDAKGHLQMKEETVESEGKIIPSWQTYHTFGTRDTRIS